ncbi:MAG: RNA polymerase sigma factor [Cyclobacteriaceae bacterium]
MQNEDKLIEGCCKGDRMMQQELYQRFSKRMLVICMRYSKATEDAEDILQEAFIKVFQNINKFRKDSSLGYWIKRIVINTALNYQRGKLYLFPMVDIQDVNHNVEKETVLDRFHFNELLEMVQALPVGCQVIFNLYAIEGYPHKEIAKQLNISEGTSKSQYARAKKLLQQMVEQSEKVNYEKFQ